MIRPYIIIPKLILQPTWGGHDIVALKKWTELYNLGKEKIGQSYELYNLSKLSLKITNTLDHNFIPEIGNPDDLVIVNKDDIKEYINLSKLIETDKENILGKNVIQKHSIMPLLNKLTQSYGNSYQIHIREKDQNNRWIAKPESWFFLEDGYITLGINKDCDLKKYKETCLIINNYMMQLSNKVVEGRLSIKKARDDAKEFIKKTNIQSYVKHCTVPKYSIVDVSPGGIHHSWEEDGVTYPKGNFLYEVQYDISDPQSTIRCFDQGKIKDDGTIRNIHIDDYFTYIDTCESANSIDQNIHKSKNEILLRNKYYYIDRLCIKGKKHEICQNSFVHLFVEKGEIQVITNTIKLTVSSGFSCFIPSGVLEYDLFSDNAYVLKTYIA